MDRQVPVRSFAVRLLLFRQFARVVVLAPGIPGSNKLGRSLVCGVAKRGTVFIRRHHAFSIKYHGVMENGG
jgi:hypothetical protein